MSVAPKPITLAEGERRMKRLTQRLEEGQISEEAYDQTIRLIIDQINAQRREQSTGARR